MVASLRKLSADRMIEPDVLVRLAFFDFLVKFNNYNGDDSEREHYQFLYDHFAIHPAERVREKAKRDVEERMKEFAI